MHGAIGAPGSDDLPARRHIEAVEPRRHGRDRPGEAAVAGVVDAHLLVAAGRHDLVGRAPVFHRRHMAGKSADRLLLIGGVGIPHLHGRIGARRGNLEPVPLPGHPEEIIRVPFETAQRLHRGDIEGPQILIGPPGCDPAPVG